MNNGNRNKRRGMILNRGAAAAVSLFLAGLAWHHYDGICLRSVHMWLVLVILTVIAVSDMETLRIPNRLTALLLLTVLLSVPAEPEITLVSRFIGSLAVSLPMYLMTVFMPDSFGGGDVKLVAVGGLLLGTPRIVTAAFLAVLSGGSYAVWLLASGRARRGEQIAFGPFLCAGIAISMLYGGRLAAWYLEFLMN